MTHSLLIASYRRWVSRLLVAVLLIHSVPLFAAAEMAGISDASASSEHAHHGGEMHASGLVSETVSDVDASVDANVDVSATAEHNGNHQCFNCVTHCSGLTANTVLMMPHLRPVQSFSEIPPLAGIAPSSFYKPPRLL